MSKCLNCGKEVKNKFCNVSCQNEYKGKLNKQKYEENPCTCAKCGNPLPWEKRRNKYCSSSCAASINNIGVNRYNSSPDKIIEKFKDTIKAYQCSDEQFKEYIQNFTSWKQLYEQLGYSHARASNKIQVFRRCDELGLKYPELEDKTVTNRTKGDLFSTRKNWQSARSDIRDHAQKTLINAGIEQKCIICGYDKHIEVAHIKAVSEFDDSATVAKINDIKNLIPLCPNHHWEFDHNCLSNENLQRIKEYNK